jgi:hypothetical protein
MSYQAPPARLGLGLLALLSGAACDDQTNADAHGGHQSAPLYVFANEVFGEGGDSITYVNALTTLDIKKLDLKRALEFPGGRATVMAHGGKLFVAPPESQIVERYEIHDDGSFHKTGELSFAKYGIAEITLDEWGNAFVSDEKAYLFNAAEGNAIAWNPEAMELLGEVDAGEHDLLRTGMELSCSTAAVRGDRLFRFVYWQNWDTFEFSEEQYLLVYDTKSDTLIDMVRETRCPALSNRVDVDEEGNLYFSNWIWNVGATLTREAPKSCALRIQRSAERFDDEWMLRYADVTDGREGAALGYLRDGKILFSVFHDERATIAAETVGTELVSELHWQVWIGSLDERDVAPLEGLGALEWNAGAVSTYHVGERAFILVPGEEWSVTHVYEIADGRAEKKFEASGWSYQFFKLR